MKNEKLESRLNLLKELYTLFAEFSEGMEMACREGCSSCCTRNVTLSSLEGQYIIHGLEKERAKEVLRLIEKERHRKRLIPKTTINELARLYMADEEPEEDSGDPSWGACPLLMDDRCTIYDLRPLACRSMVSEIRCDTTGYAEMNDYMITLSNVFMQYLEQIDSGGFYGNISDILPMLQRSDSKSEIETVDKDPAEVGILVNSRISVLMVPPEHREKIAVVIDAIRRAVNKHYNPERGE